MQDQVIAPYPEGDIPTRGIYVADGYGIKVHIRNKHLVVADGIGSYRREQRFHKATGGLRRLVVLGHTGYVTFEALRWMTDAEVGYLQLDRDGTILATTGALGVNKAELRRAQALAAGNQTGVNATRWILQRKLDGQANVAENLSTSAADEIREGSIELDEALDLESLRYVESLAARTYWNTWTELPVHFVKAHQKTVPDHWKTFGTRGSPFGSRARLAVNPANALLNYLYALLEGETTLASIAAGLDPGLGTLHTDKRMRASMSLDLMEAVRPDVDAYLLDLIEGHVFRKGDFTETRTGVCRVNPPLTHHLAETLNLWYDLVAPVVETTIRILTDGADNDTHLTQNNRRPDENVRPSPKPPPIVRTHCLECGAHTTEVRKLCDVCRDAKRGQHRLDRLSDLRAAGIDPAHGGPAATQRGETNRTHQTAVTKWNSENQKPRPEIFTTQILPGLRQVSIKDMVEATGLTAGYCSFIRRGIKTPHPRHWTAFELLAQKTTS